MSSTRGSRFSILPARAIDDIRFDKCPKTFMVLAAICTYSNKDGWCWPAETTLGIRLGCSRQSIHQHILLLIKWGYILKKAQARPNGSTTSNNYKVLMDADPDLPYQRQYSEDESALPPSGSPIEPTVVDVTTKLPLGSTAHMTTTIANACHMDLSLNIGMLRKNAKDLLEAGYTVQDIVRLYGENGAWYGLDFRGKKGEIPTIGAIRATIATLMHSTKGLPEEVVGNDRDGYFL